MLYRLVFSDPNSALERSASPPITPTWLDLILFYLLLLWTSGLYRNGALTIWHIFAVNTLYQHYESPAHGDNRSFFPLSICPAAI